MLLTKLYKQSLCSGCRRSLLGTTTSLAMVRVVLSILSTWRVASCLSHQVPPNDVWSSVSLESSLVDFASVLLRLTCSQRSPDLAALIINARLVRLLPTHCQGNYNQLLSNSVNFRSLLSVQVFIRHRPVTNLPAPL